MLLWVLIALMTGAAAMAVLAPLGRVAKLSDSNEQARRIYLDQLKELERDQADGRIASSEAGAARAEIGRRLLAAEGRDAGSDGPPLELRRGVALVALVGIPLLSIPLYLGLGAPTLPGQPLAARLSAPGGPQDLVALLAKVEAHLADNPEDGRGWDVIAPVYRRLGRTDEAVRAFRNAIRLVGSSAARQSGLGEAIIAAEDGIVTADARAAFEAARAADPAAPAPRFYLALAKEQEGEVEEARAEWRALLAEAPANAPWKAAIEQALARGGSGAEPGPTPEDVAAAQAMTPADRANMVEGMVAGLAERLQREPDDVDGWLRLIRSYSALGRPEDAAAAAETALQAAKQDVDRERVERLMSDLGLAQEGTAIP